MAQRIEELSIVKKHFSGKVRDIYDLGDELLIVTSDRISAFDVVFPDEIPNKGKILTQISVHFFKETKDIIENHFITDNIDEFPAELHEFREELEDRSMLVRKTRVIPFECIVRGYITGSAWKEYKAGGTVGGYILPEGLQESQRFPEALFTPSTKEEEGHDVNITYNQLLDSCDRKIAEVLKHKSLELYRYAHTLLWDKGIIFADTKFEFGTIGDKIILIDEMLTPDSSRYWDIKEHTVGATPNSYDKQYVRDYISAEGWDKEPPAPKLPKEVIEKSYEKYYQAYKFVVGEKAKKWDTK
ncbi:MAG: phosphoribosylaminoimidazolesuccinocarboxamide synthase [Candidatus Cloacimonetes bacterium 4572_65]|nr:MAG: phosphoribosylaminoimidazolesuccinocarboxamide synthase [Candidatus Cloacimonetes bacterium 4572_65]